MIVALGSLRPPKIEALKRSLAEIRRRSPDWAGRSEAEIWTESVETGAPDMPLSAVEALGGARERAENLHSQLLEQGRRADFCVGLEGGIERLNDGARRLVLLESWAYVFDGARGSYGRGGGIVLPEGLSEEVIDRGEELGPAADRYFGLRDVRSRQGTWGVLTSDLLSRRRTFEVALIAAWAPFYNPQAYD